MNALVTCQIFPWPAGPKATWYRTVQPQAPAKTLKYARTGDLLQVRYPSGTPVNTRVIYIERDLTTGSIRIQVEPIGSTTRKLGKPVDGMLVPADYKHKHAKC